MTTAGGTNGGHVVPAVGTQVISSDGHDLGTVKEIATDCFKVDVRLRPDYWLATDTIASATGNEVRLNVTKDHLDTAKVEGPEHRGFHLHRK